MKADTLKLKELFQKDIRYVIPTFQRPYVWNQEDQWEPLWEDVRNAAERYLEQLAALDAKEEQRQARAETGAGSHFLGAVVLQQEPTASAEIETRLVIDGQQRMATLQLILDAAQETLEELGFDTEGRRLNRLVLNGFAVGDDIFKLWPTQLDRDAFRAAMANGQPTDGFSDSLIVQAHEFYKLQIGEWVAAADNDEEMRARVHGLETALFGLLEVVVIDLGPTDDAYVIFETLNARGTPLLASDLVKNFILQTANSIGLDPDVVYRQHWAAIEKPWWREDIRQGRLIRPRVDSFLNYWLVTRLADEVPSHAVFPTFRDLVAGAETEIESVVADVVSHAATFEAFDSQEDHSPEGTFFYRWRIVDAGVSTPLLLWFLNQASIAKIEPEEARLALGTLESFLIRRMVCRMTTKDYNRLFVDALGHVKAGQSPAQALRDYLGSQESDSRLWPDNRLLKEALIDLPLYRLLTRRRLRMVLEALEESLRNAKAEDSHVTRGKLTIEHVIPQSWEEHWPLPVHTDREEATRTRNRLIHSVGNLTLVTKSLNPALSNSDWQTKRSELAKHTTLHLNKALLDRWSASNVSDAQIAERSASLADQLAVIWPGP